VISRLYEIYHLVIIFRVTKADSSEAGRLNFEPAVARQPAGLQDGGGTAQPHH